MKQTNEPSVAINIAAIDRFDLSDGFFEMSFKDGSLLKWRARGSTLKTGDGNLQIGRVPVFPAGLIGAIAGADLTRRCQQCGDTAEDVFLGLCDNCLPTVPAIEDSIAALRRPPFAMRDAEARVIQTVKERRDTWMSLDAITSEAIVTDVFRKS